MRDGRWVFIIGAQANDRPPDHPPDTMRHATHNITPATTSTLFGGKYTVEIVDNSDNDGQIVMAYYVAGPRGAFYGLCRSSKNPHALYVVNAGGGSSWKIRGHEWFSDATGEIVPA